MPVHIYSRQALNYCIINNVMPGNCCRTCSKMQHKIIIHISERPRFWHIWEKNDCLSWTITNVMFVTNKQEWSIYKALLWIAGVNLLKYLELRIESPQTDLENLQLLQIRRCFFITFNCSLQQKTWQQTGREGKKPWNVTTMLSSGHLLIFLRTDILLDIRLYA